MSGTIPSFPASWNIEAAKQIADTPAGVVYAVTRGDGSPAVAKVLKKKVLEDSLRGADFIAWRAGVGCVELLERSDDILLMEHAGAETLRDVLFRDGDDDATTQIAADVLLQYHQPSQQPPPSSLLTLPLYFESLFRKAEQDRTDGVESIYVDAAALAQELIDRQRDVKPLHGDLHHENIMRSGRGWIIIDPAGLIGDAALDVANMFSNPLDRFDLTRSEARIASMAAIFSRALQRDERVLLQYAFAYGCLSATWHEEDSNAEERDNELAVAATVKTVLKQF
ncbi:phosphotransferase [Agrobacterium genomosp. 3]|uniref:Streptomycin resistance protein n=1 Tax=Agrobacterium tomkonis CFBP 6623 TaxID=1183432 RepID=A0A1S7PLD6_9HYPH|nr:MULTISPECIES: aminoglycoside phosphotransferase family protein [Rhizobium/Agrobacterium group]MCA1864653.1 phosphotransferase [Agrobacterium tomkonis]KNY34666.1 streptomycin resistance protein [Agrobacterium sp. SUL3]MBP8937280.1 aminoglycoside phosphotransferase family protein [Agrobacterium sp.]MCA1875350.1 phosphotransferase [Agrobacterium tumefaciens]MCA1891266.1 phosphotransferase [Agrobacterium tomkonis]